MDRRTRTKLRLAAGYALAGLAALSLLFWLQDFPPLWQWIPFAAVFVYLEWRAVEVNDRLFASPTVMVALTAAVVFGKGSAAVGLAAMAALALFTPNDIRERRWFQPVANFGQLVVTHAASGLLLEQFLPTGPPVIGEMWIVAAGASLTAVVHAAINFTLVGFAVRRVYGKREVRPWSGMRQIVAPYTMMGFLGGLLGATYLIVGPVTLPMILVVFAVGYMTFASYSQLREAHEATLRGFIKALEAKDLYTRGHTERVAYFAKLIGEELGYKGDRLERLRIAALVHDVGKLAVPRDLIRKRGRLTEDEYQEMQAHAHIVEDILAEVEFLRPMVEIASGHHSHFDGTGYGGSGHNHGERPSQEARILAVADAFDAMTSNRSYRAALSQEYAFEELRRGSGTQFDPEVVEAFITALTRTGEVYGSPRMKDEEAARGEAESWMVWHG